MRSLTSILGLWITFMTLQQQIGKLSALGIVVNTTLGEIQGYEEQVGRKRLLIYLGIPYAQPPQGDLRFKKPQEMSPWEGVKPATMLPPACIQRNDSLFEGFLGETMYKANTGISEDCLYVNVWAPSKVTRGPKAVMVWIYGGGFFEGTSTLDLYNPKYLASSQDVVVASMNYRVGPLGFLYNGKEEAPGNQGLLDQQMALRWVKDNIARFGGDPDRITIFGMSAGSGSVSYHLLSEGSHDLFNYAILQSGSALSAWAFMNNQEALEMSKDIAKSTGCKDEEDISCLVEAGALDLFNNFKDHAWIRPTVDGDFLKDAPIDVLRSNNFKKTGIIVGLNRNEGNIFSVYRDPDILDPFKKDLSITKEQFQTMLEDAVKVALGTNNSLLNEAVRFQYTTNNPKQDATYIDIIDQIRGDSFLRCDIIQLASYYADAGSDVYMYYLEHRTANYPWPAWMGAVHGISVDYVFGNPAYAMTPQERQLSRQVMTYWGNFAKKGNPRGGLLPEWPLYTSSKGEFLQLSIGDKMKAGDKLYAQECAFWNNYVPTLESHIEGCMRGTSGRTTKSWSLLSLCLILFHLLVVTGYI